MIIIEISGNDDIDGQSVADLLYEKLEDDFPDVTITSGEHKLSQSQFSASITHMIGTKPKFHNRYSRI